MDMNSVQYHLMDMRTNGILSKVVEADEDYQEIDIKFNIFPSSSMR